MSVCMASDSCSILSMSPRLYSTRLAVTTTSTGLGWLLFCRLLVGVEFRIPSKRDLVQSLSTPCIQTTPFNEVRTRPVGLDRPPIQHGPDTATDPVCVSRKRRRKQQQQETGRVSQHHSCWFAIFFFFLWHEWNRSMKKILRFSTLRMVPKSFVHPYLPLPSHKSQSGHLTCGGGGGGLVSSLVDDDDTVVGVVVSSSVLFCSVDMNTKVGVLEALVLLRWSVVVVVVGLRDGR